MECTACGSKLLRLEHQARSADEAQTVMITCPNCPLSLAKLDIDKGPPIPHVHLQRFERQRQENIPIDDTYNISSQYILMENIKGYESNGNEKQARCVNRISPSGALYRQYIDSPWGEIAISETKRLQIGPRMLLVCTKNVYNHDAEGVEYSDFLFSTQKLSSGREIYYIIRGSRISCIIPLPSTEPTVVVQLIKEVYIDGYHPKFLTDCIDRVILGRLSNLSSRAYDMARVDENEHLFSTKPDGERIWISRIGLVWFYSRRHLSHEIIGWDVDPTVPMDLMMTSGPIIDTEMMLDFKPILIDVLAGTNLEIDKITKDPLEIVRYFKKLLPIFPYLRNIHIRDFFTTLSSAEKYRSSVLYPTDGIVALAKTGVDMYKIKSIKSIELRVTHEDILVTEDGMSLFKISHNHMYDKDSIIELRIKIHGNKIDICETLPRPDKIKANTSDVIRTIIMSAYDNISENIIRTHLWRWSNDLRLELYSRAQAASPGRRLILDVGSGDGQASEAYTKSDECSYILIEPDEDKCKLLQKRLHRVPPYTKEVRSLLQVLNPLKRGRMKYFIINATLGDVLNDQGIMNELSDSVKCCIATFSSQYIIDLIPRMVYMNMKFIGCCYTYDDVGIGESIINYGGIRMMRTSQEQAEVKWGKDKVYTEPAIESSDMPLGLNIVDAPEIVEPKMPPEMGEVLNTCYHVKVITGRWR